jgi:hypothetical protein
MVAFRLIHKRSYRLSTGQRLGLHALPSHEPFNPRLPRRAAPAGGRADTTWSDNMLRHRACCQASSRPSSKKQAIRVIRSARDLATRHGECLAEYDAGCDVESSVKGCQAMGCFHVWTQEGTSVRRWRRSWLLLAWCLWIIVAAGAVALAGASHPTTHVGAHPLLCIDPSYPVALGDTTPMLLAGGRKLRSPSKMLIVVVHPIGFGSHSTSILDVPAEELSWPQAGIPWCTAAFFQPVLRQ